MEWVKLIATPPYYIDAALLRAGEAAEVLFCRGLAYCGTVESRGVVDKTVLPMLCPKPAPRAAALVREGLWLDEGDHYLIRTWDKWQDEHDAAADRKRRDRDRKREARRKAADESGDASADSPRTLSDETAESPVLDREGEEDRDKKKTASRRASQAPTSFEITPELHAWGRLRAPFVTDPVAETEQFLDYHRAKGSLFKDWTAAWRKWMAKASEYAEERGNVRPIRPTGTDPHDEWGFS